MDESQFWQIIESTLKFQSADERGDDLGRQLRALSPEAIQGFQAIFETKLLEAYRWDLWAIATIMYNDCSDSCFEYFREWIIGQGEQFYKQALQNPRRVADVINPGSEPICEELLLVGFDEYYKKTGSELDPTIFYDGENEPVGEKWTDEQLRQQYPDLCAKYNF